MAGYVGNVPVPQSVREDQSFTATAGQTTFNTLGYTDGTRIKVTLNGVLLEGGGVDYTATNGSDIVLTSAAAVDDIVRFETFNEVQLVGNTSTSPIFKTSATLKNDTEEDTDGGRESTLIFKGEQSGGEISTLAEIEASHDGTADDEKGDLIFRTNDGSDGASPTEAMRIDSAQNVGIGTASTDISGNGTNYVGLSVVETVGSRRGFIEIGDNQNADTGGIGDINFVGHYQNAGHKVMASVRSVADGSTSGQRGANVRILTKADGSSTLSERVRVDSDGLKFNGDTAAENALSDYEEGTFTPTSGVTLGSDTVALYRKVGKLVHVGMKFTMGSSSSGSAATITGLPFASVNSNAARAGMVVSWNSNGLGAGLTFLVGQGNATGVFYLDGVARTYAQMANKTVYIGGTYPTSS